MSNYLLHNEGNMARFTKRDIVKVQLTVPHSALPIPLLSVPKPVEPVMASLHASASCWNTSEEEEEEEEEDCNDDRRGIR